MLSHTRVSRRRFDPKQFDVDPKLYDVGLTEIAEPASSVGDGIVTSLKAGEFHLFPDSMAKQIGGVYQNFAENIVEAQLMEG